MIEDSITVGALTFKWNGTGLTVSTPGGQHELDGNQSYDLLVWMHDEQAQNLYKSAHSIVVPGNTYEEGKE